MTIVRPVMVSVRHRITIMSAQRLNRPCPSAFSAATGRLGWSLPPCHFDTRLLGGGCQRLMRGDRRPMGTQEGADMAHCQRDFVRAVLPRVEADLSVWREMDALHRDGVGVRRDVVR